jgi:molecular chaperone GrpE (heat shock protein)
MARGFESKDVEWQQQEAAERRAAAQRPALTPEQAELARKREGLELQRTRVLKQIEDAKDARYRATLERGLKFLDDQLADLK